MDVDKLRTETRPEHESVEALLPLTGPGLTRELYGDILVCLYGIVRTWEEWAAAHAPPLLADAVRERRRSPLLESDLRFLGKDAVCADLTAELKTVFPHSDALDDSFKAAFLGAMYVMEGSTLGGQYIARHVEETLGLAAGEGDAYFRGHGQQTGAMWRSFQQLLKDLPEEYAPEVIATAKRMFGYFELSIRACPAAGLLRALASDSNHVVDLTGTP